MTEPVKTYGVYHPLLGTDIEIRVTAASYEAGRDAERAIVEEMVRLQDIFTVFDENSALCRWRSGETEEMPCELAHVLAVAQQWYETSGGTFHPATAAQRRRWLRAGEEGVLPSDEELDELAGLPLPYDVVAAGEVRRVADCTNVDLNAIAKGYIVDAGVGAAWHRVDALGESDRVDAVIVNAGGDLRHAGTGRLKVGVEDPILAADNIPPLEVVSISNAAVATSGFARRGFDVGSRWYGHVIDPRTARPVEHTASTTVIADDAMTADALATVLGVLPPEEALAWAEARDVPVLLVIPGDSRTSQRVIRRSKNWPS